MCWKDDDSGNWIDVASQSDLAHWTLGQWATYYHDPNRTKVRNVISLEVSHTPLSDRIVPPKVVRLLDWVDNIWPKELKAQYDYPKVQKYCLMSVARCWTVSLPDLHIVSGLICLRRIGYACSDLRCHQV